jgi:hypothetical protein
MTHTEFRSIILLRSGYLEDQERYGRIILRAMINFRETFCGMGGALLPESYMKEERSKNGQEEEEEEEQEEEEWG